MYALHPLRDDLAALREAHRHRSLSLPAGLDFASNDYLGLASSPDLAAVAAAALARGVPIGTGGSRLLRGHTTEHALLEEEAARFFGAGSALYTSTGYAANAMLLSTLPQRADLVVHDALVHASAREGMRLGRAATTGFAHGDPDAADAAIRAWRRAGGTGTVWIAVESLYSMDGDRAPLDAFAALADRHQAMLLIDEAHATGVYGPDGRGLAAGLQGRENVVSLHTCGKALGCEGALILGPKVVREFLINRGRGFIFSTAPSPLMAAVVRGALAILAAEPERRTRLDALVRHAGDVFARLGHPVSGSPIQPIVLGDNARTMAVAAALRSAGFDVRGIRPPTVPAGSSRLRVSLTLNVDAAAVDRLADALGALL